MRFFRTSPEKLPAAESEMIFSKQDLKQLLLPLLAEQFLVVLIGMMDTIMVSYCGESAMSGVSLVDSINVLLIGVFSALATGGAVLVSQYLGQKRPDAAKTAAKMLFYVVLLVSLAIMAVFLIFRKPLLLAIFGTVEEDVMTASQIYFLMSALSYPVMAIYNAYCALLRCIGNPRATMFSSFIMNIVNLIGNSVTIFWLGWGVMGAGLATLISRSVGAYITQRALRDPHCRIPYPGMFPFEWHPSEVKKILSVGIPSGFENGLFQLGKLLLLSMIATFGTASTAANAVGNTLGSFQCLPGNAIGLAMIAVVGQCCGAHAYDQAKFYTKKLMQIVYLCMGTLNILMLLCNPIITLPFNLSPEATVLARQIVALHGAGCVIFWPMSFTMPNALRAAGDAKYTMTVAVFSMAVFRIGFGVFLATTMGMGVIGVWIAMQIDWVFRIICFLIRWHSGKWQTKTLV